MASAAHVYGKRDRRRRGVHRHRRRKNGRAIPAIIKDLGDWAFCEGINRFVFHRYAAQPWLDVRPGMSMGPWGLHYERTQTWWEQSRAWHEYLARCQYLLRQGLFVADICYLSRKARRGRSARRRRAAASRTSRPGYNFDGCTPEVVLDADARQGRPAGAARRHELPRAGAAGRRDHDAAPVGAR